MRFIILFHSPAVSAVLADTHCFLLVHNFFAASEGTPKEVPHTEKYEPQKSPPPADKYPPKASVLWFFSHFIYHAAVYIAASAFWTVHKYSFHYLSVTNRPCIITYSVTLSYCHCFFQATSLSLRKAFKSQTLKSLNGSCSAAGPLYAFLSITVLYFLILWPFSS